MLVFSNSLVRISTFVLALCLGFAGCPAAHAETIELQTVAATEPGGKNAQVPESLAALRGDLAAMAFGTFADAGKQAIKLSHKTPQGSVQVGSFTLEVTRLTADSIAVVVKKDKRPVMTPAKYEFNNQKTKQMQLPDGKKTLIVFFTLSKE